MLQRKDHNQKRAKSQGENKLFTMELIVAIIMMLLCVLVLVYGLMEYFLSYLKEAPQWGSAYVSTPP